MNPDSPKTPQEEMEARLIALLLGELSDQEAAAWRAAIATNPELAKLHDRLNKTISLVREATAKVTEPDAEQPAPLQLSEERREKLLAHFKTVKPKEFAPVKRPPRFTLAELAAVLAIVGVLTGASMTWLNVSRRESGAVYVSTDQQTATLVADTALDRTKAELLERILSVPGPGSNNVYSLNVVGYVNKSLESAEPYAANPLSPLTPAQPPVSASFDSIDSSVNKSTPSREKSEPMVNFSNRAGPKNEPPASEVEVASSPKPATVAERPQIVLPSADGPVSVGKGTKLTVENDATLRPWSLPKPWSVSDSLRGFSDDNKEAGVVSSPDLADGFEVAGILARPEPARSSTNQFLGRYAYSAPPAQAEGAERFHRDLDRNAIVDATTGLPAATPESGFSDYRAQAQRRLADEATRGSDRKIVDNRVQISGQPNDFYGDFNRTPSATPPTVGAVIAMNGVEQSTVAGRGVAPTAGLPLDDFSRDGAALGQSLAVTRAERATRSYGLEPANRESGARFGGAGGGGAGISGGAEGLLAQTELGGARGRGGYAGAGGVPTGPQNAPGQIAAGDVVAGIGVTPSPALQPAKPQESLSDLAAVAELDADKAPVLGESLTLGKLFRSDPSALADRGSAPSFNGTPPRQDQPTQQPKEVLAYDSLGTLAPPDPTSGGVPVASAPVPRFKSAQTETARPSADAGVVWSEESLRRRSSSVVLPSVEAAGKTPSDGTVEQLALAREEKVKAATLVQDGRILLEAGRLDDAEVKLHEGFFNLTLPKERRDAGAEGKREQDLKTGVKEAKQTFEKPAQLAQRRIELLEKPEVRTAQKKMDALGLAEENEELLPPSMINSAAMDMNQALTVYSELSGKSVLEPTSLPKAQITLKTERPLTKQEAIQTLEAALAVNGVSMIPVGEKFVKALPVATANAAGTATGYLNTNLIYTSGRRDAIVAKLDRIRLKPESLHNLGLGEVVRYLSDEAKKHDPEKKGVNIIIKPDTVSTVDPTTGLPVAVAKESVDMNTVAVSLNAAGRDVRLADVLNSITMASEIPIKYSIQDYAVVFSRADEAEDADLVTRTYKIDSSKFYQGLKSVGALFATRTNSMDELQSGVYNFYSTLGVDLDPEKGKATFWNDRAGTLQVRATPKDLEVIESAIQGLGATAAVEQDVAPHKPATDAAIPQPEIQTSENAFSTFSLNVSDVSFKLAAASLEQGQMPDQASIRSEEFINAFDYRDAEPLPGVPVAFAWERARYPFAHNRDLLRFSIKTGAVGRQAGRPLNLVLLLDNSGSMERADRVQIIREALHVLAGQLQPQDKISVLTFARTPRLWVDGASGDKAGEVAEQIGSLTPQGGTNFEEGMNAAYATALRHYLAGGINRVVMLTDGAANLGNVEPESLKQKVESYRKQGIALDCFGIGWEGFNDDLLETLSRNGDGRYGFINSPEEAATEFAGQLAGALQVAASDVKVQVEFNPARVTAYRQIGYAKHQLTKEQFRDNTVDAAEIAAQEAGNALYTVEVNPAGEGPLAIVRVRFKIPGTSDYREHEWAVPYTGNAVALEQGSPAMRLAASASAFSEWLVASPFAGEVTPDALLGYLGGVPEIFGADARPKKLEWMIRQAKSIEGK